VVVTFGGTFNGGMKDGESTIMPGIWAGSACGRREDDPEGNCRDPWGAEAEDGTVIGVPSPGEANLGDERSIVESGVSRAGEGSAELVRSCGWVKASLNLDTLDCLRCVTVGVDVSFVDRS